MLGFFWGKNGLDENIVGLDARCNDSVPRSSMAAMAQRSTRGGTRGMGRCDVAHRRRRLVRTYTDTLGTKLTF